MRTTIRLDDHLAAQAKKAAAETHRTLAAVIADALRAALAPRAAPAGRGEYRVPTFKGTGVRPGVNLDSNAELLDVMEGRGPTRR